MESEKPISLLSGAFRLALGVALVVACVGCSDSAPKSRTGKKADTTADCAKSGTGSGKKLRLKTSKGDDCKAAPKTGDDDDDSGSPDVTDKNAEAEDEDVIAAKNWLTGIEPMSDDDAIEKLKTDCGGCHSPKGDLAAFYSIDPRDFSKDKLLNDPLAPRAYAALVQGAKQLVGQKPQPMPPGTLKMKDAKIDELKQLVKWFETELSGVAQQGQDQFGVGNGKSEGAAAGSIKINFKCDNPASGRLYLTRLTQDAFSRNPTEDEMALIESPDEPVSREDRQKIAERLVKDEKWKKEFLAVGLKKFADKIASVNAIGAYPNPKEAGQFLISAEQAADLQQEFYQKLLKEMETKSYNDILLSDVVMVTKNTAPLYGCSSPSGDWGECTMKKPRGTFFGTIGYLRSNPTSFIVNNNNYGRSALMHFIVRGDVFINATDKPGGADVEALPDCLKTEDVRVDVKGDGVAPFGSKAVPGFANLCQSCHIDRQMAAGSILFRPFNPAGLIYSDSVSGLKIEDDGAVPAATIPTLKNRPKGPRDSANEVPIDLAFLKKIFADRMSNTEKGCVPGGKADGSDLVLKEVGDLAAYLIDDGRVLAGGLARHIPRALSNLDSTSEEIMIKFNRAFKESEGKLAPLFQAYFASETYACSRSGG